MRGRTAPPQLRLRASYPQAERPRRRETVRADILSGMDATAELILVRDALSNGTTPQQIHRLERAGELVRIRPGAYLPTQVWASLRPEARLRVRVIAAHHCLPGMPIFSHESAAVLQGIPLVGALPERAHVLVGASAPRSTPTLLRTSRRLSAADVASTDGILATSPLVTGLDLAATRTRLGGAMALSDIQHRLGVGLEELEARVEAARPFRGVRRIDEALRLSSPQCESPLESLVFVRCDELGFPRPEQQRRVDTAIGHFFVDFSWDDGQIVLEADGFGKYLDPALLGDRATAERVMAEKAREDAIRAVVRAFGRTTWRDAYAGAPLGRELERLGVPRIRRPIVISR